MQAQIKMHFTIANITEPNLRLETAHNEPNLAISKKIATKDGFFFVAVDAKKRLSGLGSSLVHHAEKALADLGCMKVKLQLLSTNEATAAFWKSLGYSVEPNISLGKVL
jgi:GNAT superfamily N-acetyltransferase